MGYERIGQMTGIKIQIWAFTKISIGPGVKSRTGAHTMVGTKKELEHGLGPRLAPLLTLELGV